jgi:hypothetical protein
MTTDFDELATSAPPLPLPKLLQGDKITQDDIVKAVNGLAVEIQLIREAVRELGTNIGTFCARVEKALKKVT